MNSTVRTQSLEPAERGSQNGLIEAFAEVALRHRRPLGVADLLRRMPYDEAGLSVAALREIAPSLGFHVHVAKLGLKSIPVMALPVIVFDTHGQAMVLTELSAKRRKAVIIIPAEGRQVRRVEFAALRQQVADVVLFIRPTNPDGAATEISQNDQRQGHWFWSTFSAFRNDYAQVVLAALLINVVGIAAPLFVKNVYDRVIPNFAIPTLWALTAGVLLALVLDMTLRTLRSSVVDATGRRVDLAVAGRLFERLLSLRMERRPASAGVLASQLREFDAVRDIMTSSTLIAVTDLVFIGIFIAVMWLLVGPLAVVPLIAVGVVLLCAIVVQFPLARAVKASQSDSGKRQGVLVEAAGSVETIKSIGAEGYVRRSWNDAVAATSASATRARFWANLSSNMVAFVNQAVSIATVVWGVFLVLDGTITTGSLIAASILSGRVLSPLGSIVQTLARAQQALSAFKTLDAMMAAPAERATAGDGRRPVAGDIVLKNVSLTYPGAPMAALSDVSIRIEKGERVGLVGRIGSGKTTVGRLISGLYEPTTGQVLIDGVDIRQFGADIRSVVGFCQQDAELFSGTLRDNIVMGRPGAEIETVERAVRLAGVDAFAARHPLGLAMPIAERGRSLSGGQRQSISLARTFVREPKILFLDEPSSAMDTATERDLVARLKRDLSADVTLLISTHRDGLLDLVDRLLVFDAGRIVLDGAKDEVIAKLREAAKPASPSSALSALREATR